MDLSGLDTSPQSPPSFPEFPTPTDSLNAPSQEMGISLLDDELMSLGNRAFDTSRFRRVGMTPACCSLGSCCVHMQFRNNS